MAQHKSLFEISTKSVKCIITTDEHKLAKETELLKKNPKEDPIEEVYEAIRKSIRTLRFKLEEKCKLEDIPVESIILTGVFAEGDTADSIKNALKKNYENATVRPLSTKEQLEYSYYSFIDEEKKRKGESKTDDIFIEITDDAMLLGLARKGEIYEFHEAQLGIGRLRKCFDNNAKENDLTKRYNELSLTFSNVCKKEFDTLKWKPAEGARLIFAGGSTKALAGGQDAGKMIQGKVFAWDTLQEKVEKRLKLDTETFRTKPDLFLSNHYSKMLSGVLSSIYVKALMEHFDLQTAIFSGFGTIDSYYYRVAMGKTRHFRFPELFKALKAHQNVFLCGPAGSGKTTAAIQCSYKLKFKDDQQQRFYFTGAISNEYKLLGYMDANGRYVSTEFRKAYENGGVFLFDEVDASFPQPLLAFNAALSGDQMDFPDGPVRKHKDFYCIATANTYGSGASRQYVGRNQLDAAFLDRFVFIDWPYDEELEKNMTDNAEWAEFVQKVRHAINKLGFGKMGVRHIVSPRATENGAALLEAGIDRRRVEEMAIWKGLERETVQMIINNMD